MYLYLKRHPYIYPLKFCSRLVALDFKTAFDSVAHSVLLRKLEHYVTRDKGLDIFLSHHNNQKQYVHIQSKNSSTSPAVYGAPQGPILGPFLFLIHIKNIEKLHRRKPRLFVDDTTCTVSEASLSSGFELKLNHELKNLSLLSFFRR